MSSVIWNDMEQQSEAWLEWRSRGLGGSDAADILGIGYRDVFQLLGIKLGIAWVRPTFAMRRGTWLEEPARQWACSELGEPFRPACGEHFQYRWMRTSLDGVNIAHDQIMEVKAPNQDYHMQAVLGMVPDQYIPQLQHNMLVTGASVCWYVSITENSAFGASKESPQFALTSMEADKSYQEELLAAEQQFYDMWQLARTELEPHEIHEFRERFGPIADVDKDKDREPLESAFWAEWAEFIAPMVGLSV